MKHKTFTSEDGEQKMKQTKLIGFLARTIKTPAIPMPPTDDSCVLPVRSEDVFVHGKENNRMNKFGLF